MATQQFFFAIDVIAFFSLLLFGLRVLVTSAEKRNARLIALMSFSAACAIVLARQEFVYWIPDAYQVQVGVLRIPFHIARNMTSGLLMILSHSLFQDRDKLPKWLGGAFALQVLMELVGALRSTNASDWQHNIFQVLPALLQLLFVGYALYWMLKGWGADLVAARRKLRWIVLPIIGAFIFIDILLERVLIPWGSIAEFHVHVASSALDALLAIFGLLAALGAAEPAYIDPFRDETTQTPATAAKIAAQGVHDGAIAAVRRAFAEQHVYRDGDLSVASLAQKLSMPEYRLRKLIHEQLRYRNFNALLHDYRIAEACLVLADPAKNSLPILTIALTVGYNSINPFNRAFREAKGMTPSAYRSQAQVERPGPRTEQTRTES